MSQQTENTEAMTSTPKEMPRSMIEITDDLTIIKIVLGDLITALRDGKKTRERSIIITQLQLVRGMVHEAQMGDDE